MDLTILEIHLDDAAFNAPLPGSDEREDEDGASAPGDGATGGSVTQLLGVVAMLLGLALLARYLRSGEEDDLPATDDVEIAEA